LDSIGFEAGITHHEPSRVCTETSCSVRPLGRWIVQNPRSVPLCRDFQSLMRIGRLIIDASSWEAVALENQGREGYKSAGV
jgi:hypothetical protein